LNSDLFCKKGRANPFIGCIFVGIISRFEKPVSHRTGKICRSEKPAILKPIYNLRKDRSLGTKIGGKYETTISCR
jgi:hypothetical protein